MPFTCETCGKVFSQLKNLNRHQRETHAVNPTQHACPVCDKKFVRKSNLDQHTATVHSKRPKPDNPDSFQCDVCDKVFNTRQALTKHMLTHNKGYYQPAGPLISHHHHHHSSSVAAKLPPAPPPSTPASLPTPTPPPSGATHAPSESSDSDVVLTSVENPHPAPYRPYPPPPPHHSQPPYGYNYQYYPSPPASNLQYPGQPSHFHQEICYPPSGYPPGYYPKGHYPPGYRRYHDYYPPPPPREFYPAPGVNPPPPLSAGQQVMVSAPGQPSASYPPSDGGYPPLTPVVDPYPPSAPPHPYPGYGAGPPPPCYTTHSPSSRGLFIDAAAFQGCPCPMQSCPKNVHTGPLTGASKGSMKHGHPQPTPLPPVALALPQEPPGALNPPSPARGSAGVPPPSPAPARQWLEPPPAPAPAPIDTANTTGLLTIGRAVTESVLLGDNTPLVPKTEPSEEELSTIKQEAPSPDDLKMCFRKRYKTVSPDIKRQDFEPPEVETTVQTELQERLITPKEEPEKTILPEDRPVEKQLPLSDKAANVPVPPVLNGHVAKTKKRKSVTSECEPTAKVAKCLQSQKFLKCTKRNKRVAEENIAPDVNSNVEPAKVICRRNSKSVERRKSCPNLTSPAVEEVSPPIEDTEGAKKKKGVRAKKVQAKTKADHLLRSHGKTELLPSTILKERRPSKSAVSAKKAAPPEQAAAAIDPSAESAVCLPGLRPSSLQPKWSNGWFWEGAPFKAKIFLNIDDGAVMRTCYPAMRHAQGDVISPRDCILLKSGQRRGDLPFVAKVAAMWEDPDSGEMMVSLLWYYRPEHTEQGRRSEDIPDEIFASRHKDTNSVACIEDKCYVLTFNEYCRYRKTVRWSEEGLPSAGRIVPPPDPPYQRVHRQPPGRVAPELVFFCRRVYDFRQKRTLKNPC